MFGQAIYRNGNYQYTQNSGYLSNQFENRSKYFWQICSGHYFIFVLFRTQMMLILHWKIHINVFKSIKIRENKYIHGSNFDQICSVECRWANSRLRNREVYYTKRSWVAPTRDPYNYFSLCNIVANLDSVFQSSKQYINPRINLHVKPLYACKECKDMCGIDGCN